MRICAVKTATYDLCMPNDEGTVAAEDIRRSARREVETLGLREAAHRMGIHRQTLVAIIAGVRVRSGSLALVREYFGLGRSTP